MDPTEDDVFSRRSRSLLRKFVRIAAEISEANDFITLVVVAQNDDVASQDFPGRRNAVIHRMVWKHKIAVQRTSSCRGCHFLSRFQSRMGYRESTQPLKLERGC